MEDKYTVIDQNYVLELENELSELSKREEASTRRMQLLVYPSMVAFIILAAYGFYLVHSLTSNVAQMAVSIDSISNSVVKNMRVISSSTTQMSGNMSSLVDSTESMTGRMTEMTSDVGVMTQNVGAMTQNVGAMSQNIGVMKNATNSMATSTGYMQNDMMSLNNSISKPLNMMNSFLPWSNSSNQRYRGSNRPMVIQQPTYYYPTNTPSYQEQQPQPPVTQSAIAASNANNK